MKPEDTWEMEGSVGTVKIALTHNLVPIEKSQRKVYSWLLSNAAAAVAGITFTIEKGITVVRTIPEIVLTAHGSIAEQNELGLLTIPPDHNIKAQVTLGTGPVRAILRCYDL